MEQHPVPQQISSYQFRLVGDMTLKQFFQLASGFMVALLIYSTNWYAIIKWPLILFFVLFGVALAFIPFRERQLITWVQIFFRAIYQPTEYGWKKLDSIPTFFKDEDVKSAIPSGSATQKVDTRQPFTAALEETESALLDRFSLLFKGQSLPIQDAVQTPKKDKQVKIPTQRETRISKTTKPKIVIEQKPKIQEVKTVKDTTHVVDPTLRSVSQTTTAQKAEFSIDAAPPLPPESANTIVGQVMDVNGRIVEGAILEVKDDAGRPVRALKTNKLGHFIVVTPLQNGIYKIDTEKEGLLFNDIQFDAVGDIIPPIAVRAKTALTN